MDLRVRPAPPPLCSLRGVGRAGSAGRRGGRAPRVLPEAFAEQCRPFDFPPGRRPRACSPDLCIAVGHLATHLNTITDALSRLSAPEPSKFPEGLRGVPQVRWPSPETLFAIRPLTDGHAPQDADPDAAR